MHRFLVAAASLALVVLLGAAAALAAPPRHVRLSWATSDTTGTMTVAWNTSTEVPSQVRYGLDASYGLAAEGTATLAPGSLGWVHEVTLIELQPDTVYHYRAGSPQGWTDDLTFRSPPRPDGCTPFSFVALGDNRSDDSRGSSPKWPGILGEAIVDDPAFVLNTGDLVKDGHEGDQWEVFLGDTSPGAALVPLFATPGNHDDDSVQGDGALYNAVFAFPRNEVTGTEDFYWFTYGDAIFVALSTVSFGGGATPYAQQAAWLDDVLTEHPKTWKIVFFHHPPYTGYVDLFGLDVNHPPNENDQNAALVPIFDKHHVDLVFNGHNHFYQRFQPLQYSSANPEEGIPVSDPADGTIYVITGGAGALTYALDLYMWGLCAFTVGAEVCSGDHHYVTVEIDGGTLRFAARTTAQQLFGSDPDNITLIDGFEIVKPGYVSDCAPPPVDAGPTPDAGVADTSVADAGATDTGAPDTGQPVVPDAVVSSDGGSDGAGVDPGTPDSGAPSQGDVPAAADTGGGPSKDGTAGSGTGDGAAAGTEVAPLPDAGTPGGTLSTSGGGGCSAAAPAAAPTAPFALAFLLVLWMGLTVGLRRRRAVSTR